MYRLLSLFPRLSFIGVTLFASALVFGQAVPVSEDSTSAENSLPIPGDATAPETAPPATGFKINGILVIDGVNYRCSGPSIQRALADAVAAGGGTVDARGCPTLTSNFTSETDVGNRKGSSPVVLLLPHSGYWASHIVNPNAYILMERHWRRNLRRL